MTQKLKTHFFVTWLFVAAYELFATAMLIKGSDIQLSPGYGFNITAAVLFLEGAPQWTYTATIINQIFSIIFVVNIALLFADKEFTVVVPRRFFLCTTFAFALLWIGLHYLLYVSLPFTPFGLIVGFVEGEAISLVLLRLLYSYRKNSKFSKPISVNQNI